MVVHTCCPSYSGDRGRRIESSRPARAMLVKPCLKTKIKTKRLGHSSNGRALALHGALSRIPSTENMSERETETHRDRERQTETKTERLGKLAFHVTRLVTLQHNVLQK
jgi:hypothetical protein